MKPKVIQKLDSEQSQMLAAAGRKRTGRDVVTSYFFSPASRHVPPAGQAV
jgi:hypothetical protein